MNQGDFFSTLNYGDLCIIDIKNKSNVLVRFIDTGYEVSAKASSILNGTVKDRLMPKIQGAGFVGVGDYKTSISGRQTVHYSKWHSMLQRCYSHKYHARNPTYKDCTVCDEWHNFQNFARWYDKNSNGIDCAELDKDILIKGNKTYGPETCLIVTKSENLKARGQEKPISLKRKIDGSVVSFCSISEAARVLGLDKGHTAKVVRGERMSHKGWVLNG